ncbi:terminase large subunit [Rhodococcus sp. IEGM 1381]|uniref:terminase large subunit n=1 Tax=Rhodococcus sp. IEGM 1381 TaxID=3047085 RepID=UPI0024B6E0A4|nr:terminase large subunit [Rhodococcus sp. IEGM 1381]MDI9895090.1 terminase large subunit [Rhodococcus sp. IEGM 1381]
MLLPAEYTKPLSANFTSALTESDIERVNRFYMLPGQSLDPWQIWLMRSVLETYPPDHADERLRGKLRYREGVLIEVPRQVGKTTVLGALMFLGYLKSAKRGHVVKMGCVASSVQQATILFDRVVMPIHQVEALSKRHTVNRQQRTLRPRDNAIMAELKAYATVQPKNLQSIPFSAPASIAVVVDEVHLLDPQVYTNMKIGLQAQPDSILVGITSAGDELSTLLHQLEAYGTGAMQGLHERFGFFRYYAPETMDGEYPLRSREMISAANPAVECGRIPFEQVLEETASIPDHEYTRYILGRHGQAENLFLPLAMWTKSAGQGVPADARRGAVFAIDRTEHWDFASIVAANMVDGKICTEVVATIKNPTTDKLTEICRQLYRSHRGIFVMDAITLKELRVNLREKYHLPVEFYNVQQLAQATSVTFSLAATNRLVHKNDPVMVKQRAVALTVASGDGYKISTKDSPSDIDSIKSMAMAVHYADSRNREKLQTISA